MDLFLVDVVSRILHVSTAIALVGGSMFTLFVLIPSAEQLTAPEHEKLRELIGGKWKKWIHAGIAIFLVTGFYNYFRAMPLHKGDGLYHALVGTKILLGLVVFLIASALVGRSKGLAFIRDSRILWLRILVLVALVIVSISGFVKVRASSMKSGTPVVREESN